MSNTTTLRVRKPMAGLAFAALLPLAGMSVPAVAQDNDRASSLHDAHCLGCHAATVYTRDDRKVDSFEALKAQVAKWQNMAGLKWSDADIELVARQLNEVYYKLP